MAGLPEAFPSDLGGELRGPASQVDAYTRQLKALLPRGALWSLDPGSLLSNLLSAVADELARIDDRGQDILREWDPSTAVETLEDWERILGLPEEGQTLSSVVSERQLSVAAKYVARGGATAAYFIEVAARLGFVATVTVTAPHTWQMTVDLAASAASYTLRVSEFRAGSARAGDRVASRNVAEVERVVNRLKPAHTIALFVYT